MTNIDEMSINAIRVLSADAIQKANSGHPGLPLGTAPTAYELWTNHMNYNPADPEWENRDRFVLSGGHGSMLLYSLFHLLGIGNLSLDDVKNFRQMGSKTPGHPEYGHTVGVEATTGPLGQGMAMAVGMAMAEAHLASVFNKDGYNVVDHYTYVLGGDGCMMEGISSECFSLAGTLGLSKLIVFYDSNNISIEGSTDIAFTENVMKRFEAFGFQTIEVADGNDIEAIGKAIEEAKADKERPSLIKVNTLIGYGCPAKQGKASAHGEPLGVDNVAALKENLNWPCKGDFEVPQEVYDHYKEIAARMAEPEEIVASIHRYFERQGDLLGKKVLLTAGPTYEKIDPVRFIGNYSSGKMGFALAEECARRGAEVTLIAGPVQLKTQHSRIHRIDVESAQEMYEAAQTCFPTSDVGILCAAVADFRPETVAGKKIKREKEEKLTLHLQATQDIAASLGKIKEDNQLLVGFALETNNEQQNAEGKLERKNFDFIVLNSLNDAGAGFRHDTNKISIIDRKGREDYPLKPKQEVAQDIINHLVAVLTR